MGKYLFLILINFLIITTSSVNGEMVDTSGYENKLVVKLKNQLTEEDLEFRLIDQYGIGVSLGDYYNHNKVKIILIHPDCQSLTDLQKFKKKLPKKTAIIFITKNTKYTREELILKFPKFQILIDENNQVSKSFGLNEVGQSVLLDSKSKQIVESKNEKFKKTDFSQCKFQVEKYIPGTFEEVVLPALSRSCLSCHANQKYLNFFQDFNKIASWKNMMLRTIRLKRMPPGGDPYYGELLTHHTTKDLEIVTNWLEADSFEEPGAKTAYDNFIDQMRKKKNLNIEKIKEKSEILFPEFSEEVKELGLPFYKHYRLKEPTTKDLYFNAFDVKINENVAHHIALHHSSTPFPEVDAMGNPIDKNYNQKQLYGNFPVKIEGSVNGRKISGFEFKDPNIIHISRTSGFQSARMNTIYYIPKGSYLNFEIHYSPSGTKEISLNELKVYHRDELKSAAVIKRFSMTPDQKTIMVRPNEKHSLVSMKYKLSSDVLLSGYGLHMHYRGKSGQLKYKKPDEKEFKTIFSIPTYQYKNQISSSLNEPILLPKGTELLSEIIYDNSKENTSNPDPSKNVKIGLSILEDENYLPRILHIERAQ
jgi:hypothetical protein